VDAPGSTQVVKTAFPNLPALRGALLGVLLSGLLCSADLGLAQEPLRLSVIHINDTHSHLEPTRRTVRIDGNDTGVFLGGFPRLASALKDLRADGRTRLFLHAGDAVQGTLYFNAYRGEADFRFLNLLGVEAMTLGNHEFDKGPDVLARMLDVADFPILSANIRFPGDSRLAKRVTPYAIKGYGADRVGIVGVTTRDTPVISKPGPSVVFQQALSAVRRAVRELEAKGVDKIIVLSHIGYDHDIQLARRVRGVDIVVGGHSHTLLGGAVLRDLGLEVGGDYPTVVRGPGGAKSLVVQAWKWGMVLGVLDVEFNRRGEIETHEARPLFIAGNDFIRSRKPVEAGSEEGRRIVRALTDRGAFGFFRDEEHAASILAPYRQGLEKLRKTEVATALSDLRIGVNGGPGPLVADAMAWKTGSAIALQNRGGVRAELREGAITLGDVAEVLPFENVIVLLDVTAAELRSALEEGIEFQMARRPSEPGLPYVSGMSYQANLAAPRGKRIVSMVRLRPDGTGVPFDPKGLYRIALNDFIANGGDGHATFRQVTRFRRDTGLVDSDVFAEYLRHLGEVREEGGKRIEVLAR